MNGALDPDALMWIDGELIPSQHATVSATDHALLVGDGAFETLKVLDTGAFAIRRHLHRLRKTLAALSIEDPGEVLLREAVTKVITANELTSGRIRITVTAGAGPLGSGEPSGPARVVVAGHSSVAVPSAVAVTVPWTRNETGALSGLKTTSYAENVRALRYAHDKLADEAIFSNTRGDLCEGTGSNIFVVVAGRVQTPPLSSGCLAGITRELVLELAEVDEVVLPLDSLGMADEVFLTSSTRDIQSLERVDNRALKQPAPITADIAAAFAYLMETNIDP